MSTETSPPSRTVQVRDLTIRYHELGEGPAVICLHGGGPGASGWSNYSKNAAALSEAFRVIIVDLPGYGESDKPKITGPLNSWYALFLVDFMTAIGIEKAHFIGNSLGGGAALKLAIDAPERVDRLALMGPGGGLPIHSAAGPSEGIRHLVRFYEGEGPTREKFEAFIRLMVFDQSQLSKDLFDQRYAAATRLGVADNFPLRLSIMSLPYEPLWPLLNEVRSKTLLLWGRDDRTNTVDNAYIMLNQIPDAELHVFSKCGHWVQWEKAEAFNRLVTGFLSAA